MTVPIHEIGRENVSRAEQFMNAARQVAGGADARQMASSMAQQGGQAAQQAAGGAANRGSGGGEDNRRRNENRGEDEFDLDARDFPSARDQAASPGTRIQATSCSIGDSAEHLSRSNYEQGPNGPVHVITPMVMPKGTRVRALFPAVILVIVGIVGSIVLLPFDLSFAVFGPHYVALVIVAALFMWWRAGMVMVPEGCVALISRFERSKPRSGPGWSR
ncbi:hypothetical protein [Ornithinimicrobium sp. INDO-MA30-4]|uniref:hypothetical protein n=1 Tax=Ornithinimicrobium sp. INDO-MA30-4 TaxID=2908651 RepID=UPI001F489B1A|nr:hypothetical protein [Ornithinimicrobium sp. INDO-MA30-4]UJH69699.1 hypothetical protein L0A91_10240 [Ornithinimicrobium sp. INDO-MA30-4]